ncbi:hypothetical protein C8Q69DRAFT_211995 [Paecilomyces variotii]|uniref:Uncharacterized protein n=1 Tax=Byssochlamys spectabilis TaxID=264951 RepID=A0A443HZ00_BYSSP|nr:hypothetical protein C8Q69DRAFT_211995 [Paecilomyces variotii]RWQ96993.1 hypothetical protein C8Q69DRAFT_211995 [Paecilomyces variotii]
MLLLQSLSHLAPDFDAQWTIRPAHFTAKYKREDYTAITDGQLRTRAKTLLSAIIEVKRWTRTSEGNALIMQEVGEIVAWITTHLLQKPAAITIKSRIVAVRAVANDGREGFLLNGGWFFSDFYLFYHFISFMSQTPSSSGQIPL